MEHPDPKGVRQTMTAIILQARLDSQRLPGKSLLPLGGRPLIFRVMEALTFLEADRRILACPEDCTSSFAPLAEEAGFEIVTGPKENVLSRFCIAIRRFKVDRIIRATGDNPFVLIDAAQAIGQEAEALRADYACYAGIPHGSGVECIDSEALLKAEKEAESDAEREHVCPFLYAHPEIFFLHRPLAPRKWQDLSMWLTVDTREDLDRAEILYRALTEKFPSGGIARCQGESVMETYRKVLGKIPRNFTLDSLLSERHP
jgi:spore coat polysaccharide biosynthesis protein SpsF